MAAAWSTSIAALSQRIIPAGSLDFRSGRFMAPIRVARLSKAPGGRVASGSSLSWPEIDSGATIRIILRPIIICEGIGRSRASPGLTSSPVVSRIGIALLPFLTRKRPSASGSSERWCRETVSSVKGAITSRQRSASNRWL